MNLSTNQRIIIVVVFALYTIALLAYSLVTRNSMKKGKGDYLSKFYTGGRNGGILITAMMVSAGVQEPACSWVFLDLPTPLVPSGWYAASSPLGLTSWCLVLLEKE